MHLAIQRIGKYRQLFTIPSYVFSIIFYNVGKADGPYKRVRGGVLAATGRPYGSNEAGGACGLLAATGRPYGGCAREKAG